MALATCAGLVLSPLPAPAAGPQLWRVEGAKAFLEGDLDAVSVDELGRLRLGPSPALLHDPESPNAWAVARDAKGVLYVGTGNEGLVVRVDGKKGSVIYDAEEVEVHAVAAGRDGRVYAATSPNGAVYAIDAAGKATRFFDPAETYIWALAFDASGRLHVATGNEGAVYRVSPDGTGTRVLTAADTHVLSLAFDSRGRLYAGTAPEGLVYRLDTEGRAYVVLDSRFREIRALDVGADGVVYAAAIDGRTAEARPAAPLPGAPGAPAAAPAQAEVTVSESFAVVPPGGGAVVPVVSVDAPAAAPTTPRGAVLGIRSDSEVDVLWSSTEDVPHAILATGDGVLVGTGNRGRVYRARAAGQWTLVATMPAEQVTALCRGSGAEAIVATANPARVYSLGAAPAAKGTFVSRVKDAEAAARWGRVAWEGVAPAGTTVIMESRAGNTDRPDATWTDWRAVAGAAGEAGHGDRARFLQVRLSFAGREGRSPTIEGLSAAFLQHNLPPELRAITVHPPGEVFQKPISVSGDPEVLGLDPAPTADGASGGRGAAATPPAISFSRKLFQRGLRTFSWQADDPNGDGLRYDVLYRAVGDERWQELRKGLGEPVVAWDTSAVPNGRYVIRVVATDEPANPPALAATATRDSASFEVDNSPPAIDAAWDPARRVVRVTVSDEGAVRRLEYAVDAGRWVEVHPGDGLSDSPEERYEIALPTGTSGPRLVVLRASDWLGNLATRRVDVP